MILKMNGDQSDLCNQNKSKSVSDCAYIGSFEPDVISKMNMQRIMKIENDGWYKTRNPIGALHNFQKGWDTEVHETVISCSRPDEPCSHSSRWS